MLIGMPIAALILPFLMANMMKLGATEHYVTQAGIALLYVMVYWSSGRFVTIRLRIRFPGLQNVGKRALLQGLFMMALILMITVLCKPFFKARLQSLYHRDIEPDVVSLYLISLVLSLAILGIYETIWGLDQWKKTLVEAEQLRRENLQAQMEMLKSQVNPHFLFNSLNTLSSLVHDSPDLSVEFIQKLSTTYRYVLEIKDRELIQLREEMNCVNAYLFLLRIRFGEALVVHIDIPTANLLQYVVPLSLQMLIENAIKHNIVSRKKPLYISIELTEHGMLIVRNNLQRKDPEGNSTGTGLANIQSRYQLLVKQEVLIVEDLHHFAVTIPLVKLEKYAPPHR